MNYRKVTATVLVVLGLIVGGLFVPLPLHIEAAFLVEPNDVRHIFTKTPGRLVAIEIEPGQRVEPGQVLARLKNEEKEDHYRKLKIQLLVQEKEVVLYHALDEPSREHLAKERLQSIESRLRDFEDQLRHLTVVALVGGTMVEPPRRPEPKNDPSRRYLQSWYGTPLESRNLGCFLDESTHLLSIAPNDQLDAVLLIDQADRNDVQVGQSVELKFEHLPDRTYIGTVEEISDRHMEFVPEALSNKMGGKLATVTDSQGRERLTSIAYQARVRLTEDTELMKSGMQGQARFFVDRRSAGQWIWRYLRRTFHFRL